jgi:hypothetical protein
MCMQPPGLQYHSKLYVSHTCVCIGLESYHVSPMLCEARTSTRSCQTLGQGIYKFLLLKHQHLQGT